MSDSVRKNFTAGNYMILYMSLILLLGFSHEIYAAEQEPTAKPEKLFTSSESLAVTISAPWRKIERNDTFQGSYPAKIEWTNEAGDATALDMMVQRRGLTRQAVCRFPPIKLLFDKEVVKGSTFRGQKSLKMVTHCKSSSQYQQYYILEMLAYQMYNIITDFSFRARPLSVVYVDSERGSRQDPKFAFLIETHGDVAKRNGQKKLDIAGVKKFQLEPTEASNFALFQYMISNLDWSALSGPDADECCHNSKLIGQNPYEDPVYAIPYDFDAAGLVNAPYAAPPGNLPVNSVTRRLYRGFCEHNKTMEDARQRFLGHEQAILALVRNESGLLDRSKKRALKFLAKFFTILKDSNDFQKNIMAKCRR